MEQPENTSNKIPIYDEFPYIEIEYETGRLFISKSVFELIGKPKAINVLWDTNTCALAICPDNSNDEDDRYFVTERDYKRKSLFSIKVIPNLIREVFLKSDLDKTHRYRVKVTQYYEPKNAAIIKMENAVVSDKTSSKEQKTIQMKAADKKLLNEIKTTINATLNALSEVVGSYDDQIEKCPDTPKGEEKMEMLEETKGYLDSALGNLEQAYGNIDEALNH